MNWQKFLYLILFFILAPQTVLAGLLTDTQEMDELARKAGGDSFATDAKIGDVVASLIKSFLGLLAIIFIVLILLAGYQWMTAQGEEEKVRKSQATIKRAVIGLMIIIAAYAITYFVFKELDRVGSEY